MAKNTILVKVTADAGGKMVLWERHPKHPDGEVFIPGGSGREFEVFPTPNVQARIKAGLLIKVKAVEVVETADAEEQPDATPAAVELAKEKGIDLASVTGTGADGRITKSDVENAIK